MDKGFISRIIKDTAFTSMGTACTVLFHFFSVIILSRFLAKDALGLYFLLLAVAHILTVMGGFGLDLTLVKFLSSEDLNENQDVLGPILSLRLILLVFMAISLVAAGRPVLGLVNVRIVPYTGLLGGLFILNSLRDLLYHALQGFRKFRSYASIQTSAAFLRVVLIAAAIWTGRLSLYNLILIEGLISLFCVVFQVLTLPLARSLNPRSFAPRWKAVLRFGFPLYLNNILTVIIDRANVLLLGSLLTLEGVAVYEIAGKIPNGLLRVFRSFIVVYFPNLASLYAKGQQRDVRTVVQQSLTFTSLAISMVTLVIFLFRETIMTLVFSREYLNAGLALFLLTVNFLFRALTNLMGYAVVSTGFASAPVKANSVSSLLLLVGSLVLIPVLGVMGAIVSLFIMNIVSQGIFYRYMNQVGIYVDLRSPLKPFGTALILCALYTVVGHYEQSVFTKLFTLTLYIGICRYWIKEVGIAWRAGTRVLGFQRPST